MNRGLYTAATGMWATQAKMDSIANNLANSNTIGYKRDDMTFEEGLARQMLGNSGTGVGLGSLMSGPKISSHNTNWERGAVQITGNGLDVSINNDKGLFAVETEGGIKYTRAGSFMISEDRTIVDRNGSPVLDSNLRPIQADGAGPVKIAPNGDVYQGDTIFGKVGVFEGEFRKIGFNMYLPEGATTATENVSLTPESTEGSNVNVVQTMIEMVQMNRLFEMAQKSIQSHDETTSKLIESTRG